MDTLTYKPVIGTLELVAKSTNNTHDLVNTQSLARAFIAGTQPHVRRKWWFQTKPYISRVAVSKHVLFLTHIWEHSQRDSNAESVF